MLQIRFSVPGNTDYVNGEPEPHKKEYTAYVRECFYAAYKVQKTSVVVEDSLADALMNNKGFPLRPASGQLPPIDINKFNVSVDADIYWSEGPGSASTVYFAIVSALVKNGKTLKSGQFQSQMSNDKRGRVEVTIKIE